MSFLGKFFAGRTDNPPKDGENGGKPDDAPPQLKRVVADGESGTPGQPSVKKKFEKPMFKAPAGGATSTKETEGSDTHQQQPGVDENPQNMSMQVESQINPEESQPDESRLNSSMTQPATSATGKPLSFLEKMKIKKLQEEMLKKKELESSRTEENTHNDRSGEGNIRHDIEPTGEKPKFGFMNKFKQNRESESQGVSQENSHVEHTPAANDQQEDQTHEEEVQQKKPAFKFLAKKKPTVSHPESEADVHQTSHDDRSHTEGNSEVRIDYGGLDQDQGRMLAGLHSENDIEASDRTESTHQKSPSKPRFGFLNRGKQTGDQESSLMQGGDGNNLENPNENTLNLSPVDKEKSFNMQGDLVDTLEKDDSGRPTPRLEKSQKVNTVDFVDFDKVGLGRFETTARRFSVKSYEGTVRSREISERQETSHR